MSIRFLKQLPTDTTEKQMFANQAIDEILNGEVSVLEAFAVLKHLEDTIALIKEDVTVKACLFTELDKYPKGDTPTALGYSISRGERKNYNFSECGDNYFEDLSKESKALTNKLKERQQFLQNLTQKVFDSENGGFEITPPKVTFTTYPILKEAKQSIDLSVGDGLAF